MLTQRANLKSRAPQVTERDEYAYQEMIAHVPLHAHRDPQSVLIVGGGDGGVLREVRTAPKRPITTHPHIPSSIHRRPFPPSRLVTKVCRHRSVTSITMCEIDAVVCDVAKKFLHNSTATSFNDPRLTLVRRQHPATSRREHAAMRRSHNNHHGGAWPRRRRAVTLTRTAHWHPRSEPDWFDPLRCTPTRPSSSRTSATSTTSSSSTRPTPSDLRRPSSLRGSIRRCAARCDRAQLCATRRVDTTAIAGTIASRSVNNPHRRTTTKNALAPSRPPCAAPHRPLLRQGECVWLHLDLIGDVLSHCKEVFPSVDYCYTTIPTYPSGQATPCRCCLGI